MDQANLSCPICNCNSFGPYNGREDAQCKGCGSLERSRYLWMILQSTGALKASMRVLHVAPEICFLKEFWKRYNYKYHPCDLHPEVYKNQVCEVYKMDICNDLDKLPRGVFDLIIHNHVLEHIPCDVGTAIDSFNRLLAPGGSHFFSVPFRGEVTRENTSSDLSDEERIKQFGQADHLRLFGTIDFPEFLNKRYGGQIELFRAESQFSISELRNANIPETVFQGINGHSVFASKLTHY